MDNQILIGRKYLPEVVKLVNAAKLSVHIIIFDWRIYHIPHDRKEQTLISAVLEAKKRGVDVKVIANNDYVRDTLKGLGVKCKKLNSYKIVHAKMLLVDEKIVVLGSHNFTASSFERNLEISAILDDTKSVSELLNFFNTLWG